MNRLKNYLVVGVSFLFISIFLIVQVCYAGPLIIDHNNTDITQLTQARIDRAKSSLHIAYGHTSHGSQITTGMTGLVGFANAGGKGMTFENNTFAWNNGGTGGALDLHDYAMAGDVGYYPAWADNTRAYLDNPANSDVNVIIWSWCGQASGRTEQGMIDTYLAPMTQLENEYKNVTFVYMTGHADGTGEDGNLHLRNQQIRNYAIANNKVLFDFYDIELYDPDGMYYGDKDVNDACEYDSDGNGTRDKNWALDWQNSHTQGEDWYSCSSAHSQSLNANQKAYAAWHLWTGIEQRMNSVPAPGSFLLLGSGMMSLVWFRKRK
ncbi:MAG: PEP-CTERM sorting domain-containing protein [Proteobacteria bacterium]|nr:PEP-CTERM sorting domain-containing protein [Pseudomonadota bacterium]MBU1389553.1 PEP-CTERM sorting domain-containing protein [Pseudomonadota bacterium]MBU1544417.1 PEP-CTERM sorting domain-containing protein [Pseudomonadota bacterium]MBU2430520.1 PEP-CTERM sorting domain-containing protein [Pseudomonadota bacterium]MBU2480691.1 PEP-CTERM sorting domain-containing protein [Pseudomonadota bacterium]